jgi:hypothetical protein
VSRFKLQHRRNVPAQGGDETIAAPSARTASAFGRVGCPHVEGARFRGGGRACELYKRPHEKAVGYIKFQRRLTKAHLI